MQHLHNRQTGVNADKISQLQRSHRYIRPVLHNIIDIFLRPYARLETDDRFVDVRHQYAVGQEARRVGRPRRDLAHAFAELHGRFQRLGGCLQPADYLDALLYGDRVHKVRADHPGRGRRIGRIVRRCGRGGDFCDGDGGRVGREDGVRWGYSGELGEDVGFQ